MPKYGKKSEETVAQAVRKYKKGKLKSGKNEKTVESREQAIAIGLSEARAKGAKVPTKQTKKRTVKKATRKKIAKKPTTKRTVKPKSVSRKKSPKQSK